MSAQERDAAFATFVETERGLLQRCAFLLVGRSAAADDLVAATLADLYSHWSRTRTPRRDALRLLVTTDPDGLRLPWNRRARFELVDAAPVTEAVEPVVTDLARLTPEQRLVIVLERVALLPSLEIAAVLGSGVDETLAVSRSAAAALVQRDPRRADDAVLAAELANAVPAALRDPQEVDDRAHGRTLAHRRWGRRGLVAAAVAVLVVLGVTQLRPSPSVPVADPVPEVSASATPSPQVACDRTERACQSAVVAAWRAQMADTIRQHLDPTGTYFNGQSYYPRDETDDLFTTKHGALALEVMHVGSGGGTEIYLQIATDRSAAARCGEATGKRCFSFRFMDGNRYTLNGNTTAKEGLEVQYRPDGTEVITLVARSTGKGDRLQVSSTDLQRLANDENLRLPQL